jgi:hypothetical protein
VSEQKQTTIIITIIINIYSDTMHDSSGWTAYEIPVLGNDPTTQQPKSTYTPQMVKS